ncbi:MAG: adenylate kinase [Kiritimatiellae bacterium]|jgi:adenylate kinase|nr:adenylate kinase [Kiritimatiellia bacterium]
MEIIVLMGPPGAGKGTVSESITAQGKFKHISTGDLFREAVTSGSEIGKEIAGYMESGSLVPDNVTIKLIENIFDSSNKEAKFMLDGFPRTIGQAEMLENALKERNGIISHVFFLNTKKDVLIQRLTGRRICKDCKAIYHTLFSPSKVDGICDVCGGELYQREDDCLETIENRLNVYNKKTASLVDFYKSKGSFVEVDVNKKPAEICDEINNILKEN